jgi:hypothetical protein
MCLGLSRPHCFDLSSTSLIWDSLLRHSSIGHLFELYGSNMLLVWSAIYEFLPLKSKWYFWDRASCITLSRDVFVVTSGNTDPCYEPTAMVGFEIKIMLDLNSPGSYIQSESGCPESLNWWSMQKPNSVQNRYGMLQTLLYHVCTSVIMQNRQSPRCWMLDSAW